jgi:predicted ATPase
MEICRRLDGIPLALELAAAQVETLGLSGLLEQWQDHLHPLAAGNHQRHARHQTLHATLDWSFNLLTLRADLPAPPRGVSRQLQPGLGCGGDRRSTHRSHAGARIGHATGG